MTPTSIRISENEASKYRAVRVRGHFLIVDGDGHPVWPYSQYLTGHEARAAISEMAAEDAAEKASRT